jgi:NAD(P)-dependent dehydrogenase (short-subunit alcohol dehydrogenase family)
MAQPTSAVLAGWGVLVTGGGTGIGRACAERLAADGAAVTICGRTESRLRSVAEDLAGCPTPVSYVVADVTLEPEVLRAVEAARSRTGRLKGVVANAGGGVGLGPFHTQDLAEYRRVLDLNVVGTMLCVKHSVQHMVEAGGGSFVAMSSIAATRTHRAFGAYPVAKAALDHLIRNAADEYGPSAVRFNSVQPGFVATEIMEGVPRDGPVFESYIANAPLGRIMQPDEVADVVRFLIGPESRGVTGVSIAVDGGHHLRAGPDWRAYTGLTDDELVGRRRGANAMAQYADGTRDQGSG